MKKNIKEAIKEHLMQMSLQQTRTIRGLWIDLLNTLKLRNGVQTGASIACGMMQKNVRKGKEIILLNAKMVDLT